MKAPLLALGLASAAFAASLAAASQQPPATARQEFVWPERITNAKVLPADIGAERLRRTMVGFSRSLGVRCSFCHVGPEGAPLAQLDFASDANPHKEIARGMIRLVQRLNGEDLPALLGPAQQPRVTCFTCHRGEAEPATMPPPPPVATPPAQPPAQSGERGN